MIKRRWIFAGLVGVLGVPLLLGTAMVLRMPDDGLADVHSSIKLTMPEVMHISAEQFAANDRASMVVFDTREQGEFMVSHLEGAIRLAPDMPVDDFLAEFGHLVRGKTVVFYCSVGARSTQFALKVQDALKEQGAAKVVNLEQGLFGWHNDGRPLVNSLGKETQGIHPYNDYWGQLIEREPLISKLAK